MAADGAFEMDFAKLEPAELQRRMNNLLAYLQNDIKQSKDLRARQRQLSLITTLEEMANAIASVCATHAMHAAQ